MIGVGNVVFWAVWMLYYSLLTLCVTAVLIRLVKNDNFRHVPRKLQCTLIGYAVSALFSAGVTTSKLVSHTITPQPILDYITFVSMIVFLVVRWLFASHYFCTSTLLKLAFSKKIEDLLAL